jgi:hypothetical protein
VSAGVSASYGGSQIHRAAQLDPNIRPSFVKGPVQGHQRREGQPPFQERIQSCLHQLSIVWGHWQGS